MAQALAGAFLFGGEFRRRLTFTTPVVNVKDPIVVRPEPKHAAHIFLGAGNSRSLRIGAACFSEG